MCRFRTKILSELKKMTSVKSAKVFRRKCMIAVRKSCVGPAFTLRPGSQPPPFPVALVESSRHGRVIL